MLALEWIVVILVILAAMRVVFRYNRLFSVATAAILSGIAARAACDVSLSESNAVEGLSMVTAIVSGSVLGVLLERSVCGIMLGYISTVAILMLDGFGVFRDNSSRWALCISLCLVGLVITRWYRSKLLKTSSIVVGCFLIVVCMQAIITGNFLESIDNLYLFAARFSPWTVISGVITSGIVFGVRVYQKSAEDNCKDSFDALAYRKLSHSEFQDEFCSDSTFRVRSISSDNLMGEGKLLADFNLLDPMVTSKPVLDIIGEVGPICEAVCNRFGFQLDNSRNQCEHLVFLLSNSLRRNPAGGVDELHNRMFSNYRQWTRFLNMRPLIVSSILGNRERKIQDLSVLLLAWGECANIKHMPECFCFVLHSLLQDADTGLDERSMEPGTFLSFVVKPIYNHVLRAQKSPEKINYDDINEYFWSRKCLDYHYGMPVRSLKGSDEEDLVREHIAEGLELHGKTFREQRSFLRSVLAYWRFFYAMTTCLVLLVLYGFVDFYELDPSSGKGLYIMSSVVIVMSFLSVIKSLIQSWAEYGIRSKYPMAFTIIFQTVYFQVLLLSYAGYWMEIDSSVYLSTYKWSSLVYLIPFVLAVCSQTCPYIFVPFIEAVYSLKYVSPLIAQLWPVHCIFVGRDISSTASEALKYQGFWVTLFSCKLYCSYVFQIRPLIEPTVLTIEDSQKHEFLNLFAGSHYCLLVSLWAPFVLVFFLDICIWYSVWQAITGAVVGIMKEKLGGVRNFHTLRRVFLKIPGHFQSKLMHTESTRTKSFERKSPRNGSSLEDLSVPLLSIDDEIKDEPFPSQQNDFQSDAWVNFSIAWNEVIKDLRNRDILSNSEFDMFVFRKVKGRMDRQLYIPCFLVAGSIDGVISLCEETWSGLSELEEKDRITAASEFHQTIRKDPLSLEACEELFELSMWMLRILLGKHHKNQMSTLIDGILMCAGQFEVLDEFKLDKIATLKGPLIDLVRIINIELLKSPKAGEGTEPESSFSRTLSSGSLSMLVKLQAQGKKSSCEVILLRKQVRELLMSLSNILTGRSTALKAVIKSILMDKNGFFWDNSYTRDQVDILVSEKMCDVALKSIHMLLTLASADARPASLEARRRILFFANSLFMDIPRPSSAQNMISLSTLTPFYAEDAMYSKSQLEKETEDGVSTLMFLQTVHPGRWKNFIERIGFTRLEACRASVLSSVNLSEARIWATMLGQSLYRTAMGMMLYEKAIRTLAKLENPHLSRTQLDELCVLKYTYTIACQQYGHQKQTLDPRAADIEFILKKFPNIRVAYIDNVKVHVLNSHNDPVELDEYYSVLIKSDRGRIQEIYRVKLPGNPIIGEGKPENQNHAIIFTRGETLQAIDMNQENYFEEALKMRNLLESFQTPSGVANPTTIVGFREHVFTGGLSSTASYMALQEGTFVSLGQRVLNNPLRSRYHYGHPDVFDKRFFMTRGGISKASKGINLSEDVFAGYNNALRKGSVDFKEFMLVGKGRDVGLQQLFKFEAKLAQGSAEQTLSRDIYRLGNLLDFWKLCALYCGGPGFYISNTLTICAVFLFAYAKLFWALFGFEFIDVCASEKTLVYWFGQIGFLMTLPLFASMGVDHGFRNAALEVVRMVLTGGPFFFMFQMATKWWFFGQTLLAGGAQYRPTGRGFVTHHEGFSELFRFHFFSHFKPAIELGMLLFMYGVFFDSPNVRYWASTWPLWLLSCSWWFSPFWFNPMAFEWDKLIVDVKEWFMWMRRVHGDGTSSWRAWWHEEVAYLRKLTPTSRVMLCVYHLRLALIGLGLLYHNGAFKDPLRVGIAAIILSGLMGTLFLFSSKFTHRYGRSALVSQVSAMLFIVVVPILVLHEYDVKFEVASSSTETLIGLVFMISSIINMVLSCGFERPYLRELCRFYHYAVGVLLLVPLSILSMLYLPSVMQTRLLFHNAFSKGVLIDDILRGHGRRDNDSAQQVIDEQSKLIASQREYIEKLSAKSREIAVSNRINTADLGSLKKSKGVGRLSGRMDRRPIPKTDEEST